jgi:hypothetical protein
MPWRDHQLDAVADVIREEDPDGARTASVLRATIDQLYDGQRSGRYRWDQLHKTEKTHCGTLVEINLQREFAFDDGDALDFEIAGIDVDCKYSQELYAWMIPPEARGKLCLVLWANDLESVWSMGIVRATDSRLRGGGNRDKKAQLLAAARKHVEWLFERAPLPPNRLIHLDEGLVEQIMSGKTGAARVRTLFRRVQGQLISRTVVVTTARQHDAMKRVRRNGGARTPLEKDGIIILGQFKDDRRIARELRLPIPEAGGFVSARVHPTTDGESPSAKINGVLWRLAGPQDPVVSAPELHAKSPKGPRH